MAWESMAPLSFLAGHVLEHGTTGEPDERPPQRTHSKAAWWLAGIASAVAAYFAVQFTDQVRADVSDLQRARTVAEVTHAADAAEREAIRRQLTELGLGMRRLEEKMDRLQERGYLNGDGGKP